MQITCKKLQGVTYLTSTHIRIPSLANHIKTYGVFSELLPGFICKITTKPPQAITIFGAIILGKNGQLARYSKTIVTGRIQGISFKSPKYFEIVIMGTSPG
jgi:hypothetical protein